MLFGNVVILRQKLNPSHYAQPTRSRPLAAAKTSTRSCAPSLLSSVGPRQTSGVHLLLNLCWSPTTQHIIFLLFQPEKRKGSSWWIGSDFSASDSSVLGISKCFSPPSLKYRLLKVIISFTKSLSRVRLLGAIWGEKKKGYCKSVHGPSAWCINISKIIEHWICLIPLIGHWRESARFHVVIKTGCYINLLQRYKAANRK